MIKSSIRTPKMLFTRLLALVVIVSLSVAVPLPAFAAEAAADELEITIVHTNDVHSRVEMEPYVAQLVKEKKLAGENVLLLSAGDVLHGQPLATLSRGKSIIEIMNATGYDAMVPGNHDFNYGAARLKTLEKQAEFPVLAANLKNNVGGSDAFTPYVIKTFGDVKVGIFGLATPETATKTNPSNVRYIDFKFPPAIAREMVDTLKNQGCDVIIALTHLGDDEETWAEERSTAVAKVQGIDLIVDGHSHTKLPTGNQVGNTLVVQTGALGENIGVVTLTVRGGKVRNRQAELLAVPAADEEKPALAADETVAGIIERIKKENETITSQRVASTPVLLEGEREAVRCRETNLADLITDSMLHASGAEIAFTNGGGIRASIPAGEITKGDVLTVLPFGNYIVTKQMLGADLLAALELGLTAYPETAGSFPQVGGIRFTFDPGAAPGRRVVDIQMANGAAFDPGKTYVVATNDFLADGGDGYTMFGSASGEMSYGSMDDALIEYLAQSPKISAGTDERIVALEGEQKAAA